MPAIRTRFVLSLIAAATAVTLATAACAPSSQPAATPTAPAAGANSGDSMQKPGDSMGKTDGAMMDKSGDSMKGSGDSMMMEKLPEQQFAAHFVSSTPAHGDKLATAPSSIALKFNFTLGSGSTVAVTKDGQQVNTGTPVISSDRLTLTTDLPATSGSGTYIVDYKACWPDNSCHNGKFAFTVGT